MQPKIVFLYMYLQRLYVFWTTGVMAAVLLPGMVYMPNKKTITGKNHGSLKFSMTCIVFKSMTNFV